MKNVVIIGGGISGLCSAYYLKQQGFDVTIIEKGDLTKGVSFINAGFSTPSHIFPLASPGVIAKGVKWMWNSSSPLYIKPRLDLDFFDWAWKFKNSATKAKVEGAIPVLKELGLKSRDLYEEILDRVDFESHYEKKGILTVYRSEKAGDEEVKLAERVRQESLDVEILSRDQVMALQPALSEDLLGGIYYTCDAHSSPGEFMEKMVGWLKRKGVDFRLNEEVTAISRKGRNITEVKTNKGNYHADVFLLAAGSWTQRLAKSLGLKIPIQGGKGYSFDVFRENPITLPIILAEAKVAVTPMNGFTRFAGTMEFSGNNDLIRKNRVRAIADGAQRHFRNLEIQKEELAAARSGLRPVSPDGLPFIGKPSQYDNLVVASGHAMIGWSLGAITGKLVSQIIAGQKPLVNLTPFDPGRFDFRR